MTGAFDILVPIKPLGRAKQRLKNTLTDGARANLAADMLVHVLRVSSAAKRVRRTYVVTSDADASSLGREHGAGVLFDHGLDLNEALALAVADRQGQNVQAIAVVQGDLPWLTASALDEFLGLVDGTNSAAIAPDHHGRGTSALAWRGEAGFTTFAFGEDSFLRHATLARRNGLSLTRCAASAPFHDLDDAEDLIHLSRSNAAWRRYSPGRVAGALALAQPRHAAKRDDRSCLIQSAMGPNAEDC